MNDWLLSSLRDYGPALVRWAGLLVVLLAAPLVVLAWWKRIYPHTPLVVALGVPCVLSLALLVAAAAVAGDCDYRRGDSAGRRCSTC